MPFFIELFLLVEMNDKIIKTMIDYVIWLISKLVHWLLILILKS